MKILGINISHHMSYAFFDEGALKEDYEEDQKTKQEEVDEIERSMDPRYREGGLLEGKIEIDR